MAERMVHVSRIEPAADNERSELDGIEELAASIRAVGILEPLLVYPHDWKPGCYQLLAGHRRLAAAKLARVDQVPVTIRATPAEPGVLRIIENCQRSDLSPVDRARGLGKLRAKGWTLRRIHEETGLSEGYISTSLALLDLDDSSLQRVSDGLVTAGDAITAVRRHREQRRVNGGGAPRKARVEPDHLTSAHPLGDRARQLCDLAGHDTGRIGRDVRNGRGKVACGACWEHAIREDERRKAGIRR